MNHSSSSRFSLKRWLVERFDSGATHTETVAPHDDMRVAMSRFIPYLFLHGGCLGVIWVGWSWTAVAVAAALYVVRMFAITGFYHRYFSHRSFRTSRAFQFFAAVLGNSAAQRGPLWWAAQHRHHHAHSDSEKDVHSPKEHGLYWAHMGWLTARTTIHTNMRAVRDLAQFPELVWLNRFEYVVPILLGVALYGLGALLEAVAPQLGTNGWQLVVWGFFISTVVLFHGTCTINSLAHIMGKRRYKTEDDSRNSFVLALITLGEGWHNNHHYYPSSVRQGFYWWEIDITYYILKSLARLGLIWDLRPVPLKVREAHQPKQPAKPAAAAGKPELAPLPTGKRLATGASGGA